MASRGPMNYSGTGNTSNTININVSDSPPTEPDVTAVINREVEELNYPMEGLGKTGLKSFINFRVVNEKPLKITSVGTRAGQLLVDFLRSVNGITEEQSYLAGQDIGNSLGDLNIEAVNNNPGMRKEFLDKFNIELEQFKAFLGELRDNAAQYANTEFDEVGVYQEPDVYQDHINLYMPQFTFTDGVNYDNAEMGIAGAMALAGKDGNMGDLASSAGSLLKSTIADIMSGGNGSSDILSLGLQRLKNLPLGIGDLFVKNAGLVSAATRVKLSPNIRVVFNSTNLRSFSFSFNLIAANEKEADEIEKIVKRFRTELYPEALSLTIAQQPVEIGLRFPNRFLIGLYYGFKSDGTPNPIYHKIKPCYLTGITTTYNKSQNGAHFGGKPFEVDLTLNFQESLALNRIDVEKGGY